MIWRNTADRYGAVHKTLHWIIAITVIMMLVMGWQMGNIPNGPDKFWVYGIHKSLGITILALMILRVLWRLMNWDQPKPLATHATWERKLASYTHWIFYGLLFVQPISGWMLTGAANSTINWFGYFPVPNIVGPDMDLRQAMSTLHDIVPLMLTALIGLHVAGALKHVVIDKDSTLRRMLPFGAIILMLMAPTLAQAQDWVIDRKSSKLTFEATQEGTPFKGSFGSFDGKITFDPAKPQEGKAQITIDLGSIDSGNAERDASTREKEWFDLRQTPTATYTINSFEKGAEDGAYIAKGSLTMRGLTRPLDLPFTLAITGDKNAQSAHAVGQTSLKRLDFGVGDGQWSDPSMVGLDVKIGIDLTAVAARMP